ncbi:hypothetical protein [Methanooceanicella nereidis]|uniref:hypothetical protein n=1 Tax=Methanooceanicella nereidis TaxID=2052831 RepID=UPI001E312331|nr:hypothetical protein [Methanocella sp. CWC-04]
MGEWSGKLKETGFVKKTGDKAAAKLLKYFHMDSWPGLIIVQSDELSLKIQNK